VANLKQAEVSITLKSTLATYANIVETELNRILPPISDVPSRIHESVRYSIFAGGKRIRPILCLMTFQMLSEKKIETALPQACALEMIHTYSLIHDDLPAMDNDDLRRGKPTNHKQFDEATAVLAGDALLTFAFEHLSTQIKDPKIAIQSIKNLSQAIGTHGMIGGQVLDMLGEKIQNPTIDDVEQIHKRKTGALLQSSMVLGAIAAEADQTILKVISSIGEKLGIVFQIADDILDLESTAEVLGKTVKKDLAVNKITYPRVLGVKTSKIKSQEIVSEIMKQLDQFGEKSKLLKTLTQFIIDRKN
jgi:geranylgeranyl diphosphate synthase type II